MSLGDMQVLERPKSKWPFWVLFHFKNTNWPHVEDMAHIYIKFDLHKSRIPVVIERQWAQNMALSGRKYKTQYGLLYKFLKEEDRLIFLLERETNE